MKKKKNCLFQQCVWTRKILCLKKSEKDKVSMITTDQLMKLQKRLRKRQNQSSFSDTGAPAVAIILAAPQIMQLKSPGNRAKGNHQDKGLISFENPSLSVHTKRGHFNTSPLILALILKGFSLKIRAERLTGQHK